MKKYEYAGIDVSTEKSAADAATCYINWGGFFWCFSLMILGFFAFLAVDAEEKRKRTEAEKAKKKKDRVFQMWLRM